MSKKVASTTEESSVEESSEEVSVEALLGPTNNQKCTDILCLLLFFVFWAGMVLVASIAFEYGDPDLLVKGKDTWGNVCGRNNEKGDVVHDLTDRPVLIFPYALDTSISYCAAECPTVRANYSDYLVSLQPSLCTYYTEGGGNDTKWYYGDGAEPDFTPARFIGCNAYPYCGLPSRKCYPSYETKLVFGRCVPTLDNLADLYSKLENTTVADSFQDTNEVAKQLMQDVYKARWLILGACVVALVLSFMWLCIIKYFAAVFVWGTIILVWVFFAAITIYFGWSYNEQKKSIDAKNAAEPSEFVTQSELDNQKTALALLIVFAFLTLVITCLICWFFGAINLAIDVMEEASNAMNYLWTMIFVPLCTFFVLVCFYIYWLAVYFYLSTIDQYGFYGSNYENIQNVQYYHVFGMFWTSAFIIGVTQMSLAGAVGAWYYQPKKVDSDGNHTSDPMPGLHYPVLAAVKNTLVYHMGSVAFGSLLIAICQMINYMIKQFQKGLNGKGGIADKLLRVANYLVKCMEHFLRFMSKNAYIYIAVKGDVSFFQAAKKAFFLLLENATNLTAITLVSTFLIFLGKVVIVLVTGMIFVNILREDGEYYYWVFPFIIILVMAYFIASAFMEVYGMTIDTIFICICHDIDEASHKNMDYQDTNWVPANLTEYVDDVGGKDLSKHANAPQANDNVAAAQAPPAKK